MRRRRDLDPTMVTAQPSLTRSTGRRWLVWAGVLAGISLAVLALLIPVQPAVTLTGCGIVVALYAAMAVVRLTVRSLRPRLLSLAVLMGVMAAATLVCIAVTGVVGAR